MFSYDIFNHAYGSVARFEWGRIWLFEGQNCAT